MPREFETGDGAWRALLEPLRDNPSRTAILTDVDGTLAPIAARAEDAAVPAAAREALARLSERYGLVGCVSGRRAEEARRLVGLDGIAYAGNHGLELLLPGDEAPRPDPSLAGRETEAADFLAGLDAGAAGGRACGGRTRDRSRRCTGAAPGTSRGASPAPTRSPSKRATPAWNRAGAARCWSCARSAAAARTPRSPPCSPATTSTAPPTPATTAPTSTPSAASRELREAGELVAAVCVGIVSPEAPPELPRSPT